MNAYDFTGRKALVTGGASGIGAAVVGLLRAGGAEVAIFDQAEGELDGLCLRGDIASSHDVEQAVARAESELGGLDILVHCAGIGGAWKSALDIDDAEWERVLSVNATGTFYVCRAAIPRLVANGYGRVVLVSSIAGKDGHELLPHYAASKASVIALGKSIGRDVARTGVLVNIVAPAAIETPMATSLPDALVGRMIAAIPLGRMGRPDEAAALIAWLASEDCSFSTGAVFDLSGGRSVY